MQINLTGSSGFVGKNLANYFANKYEVVKVLRNNISFNKCDVVVHLAGKAHDLKKLSKLDENEYYLVNTDYCKKIYDKFLTSDSKVFIFLSSVKSVADQSIEELTEDCIPNPFTHYGKSKLLAEQYILSKLIPHGKRVYILRPCMIHGPGNKGNLNLLYKMVRKGIPWPLGAYENKRSFCSIDNLCFIIRELIENENIPSGIYNLADDEPVSTNELIKLIAKSLEKKTSIWNTPKIVIFILVKLGDFFILPLNTERLNKLTETYIVSNKKIKQAINKPLPISSRDGLIKTLKSFNTNVQ